MKPDLLIKDKEYEKALDELGFSVVSLFTDEQIQGIRELYNQFAIDNNVAGLIASHSKTTPENSIKLSNSIQEIIRPAVESAFSDFDFFIAGFMVKEANTPGELPLHQDWNILDENLYTSYQLWIPLDLSYAENGGMFVLPGSHRFFNNSRSGSYGIPVVATEETLRPLVTDMIIPPGSALVFHNSLFHASYPNHSNINRISAIVSIYKKNAPLAYCHKNKDPNRTEIYGITPEIFLANLNTLENGGVPPQPLNINTTALNAVDNKTITAEDLVQKFKERFGQDEKSFEPTQLHILKDETLEKKIQRDGYVVLDFLNPETVAALKTEYLAKFSPPTTSIGRFTPMEHSTPEAKRHIHNFILDRIRPGLNSYFKNYQTPIASYFTKYANSKGDLTWHTDASIMLNTHLEPHYGIWCPLVDVTETNGALCVVEGSHKFSHVIFLDGLRWPYTSYSAVFDKTKKILNLKAGQMVLFDLRLVHHSTPNDTDVDRIAFCVRLTHQKSDYYSFAAMPDGIEVFEEEHDYYLRDEWSGANQAGNRTKKVGELKNVYATINYKAIETTLGIKPELTEA